MRLNTLVIALLSNLFLFAFCLPALAQFAEGGDEGGAALGKSRTQRWKAGMTVTADGGRCNGIVGYAPMPVDWPEQKVTIVDEDITPGTKIGYRMVDGVVKLMVVNISTIPTGQTAKALVVQEITRHMQEPPENTDQYKIPTKKQLDRKLRIYLGPSPYIQCRDAKIRNLAKEITTDKEGAWKKVEAMYDWVQENIKYKEGPLKGALKALRDKEGDCEELSSLFIGLCRASGVPARTVWVPGHCYAEFYLVDEDGKGHWFPCQPAGSREFGGIRELRPILQKGDNFRHPENNRQRVRYLPEYVTGKRSAGKPKVKFVRELMGKE
ncbi:MAG: transglutaminase family protein [Pirellulales bacterium]|nr:transglutaminase family protein [Pirellulales bacterium]